MTGRGQAVERVVFPSRRGSRLVGLWHAGGGGGGVILCHGMESCKEGTKSIRLAEGFAARGYDALRFDFSYVGESEGEFEDLTISGEVDDLAGAWRCARERLRGPIGIVGSSLGGTVALLFAAAEPAVAALATIAAVADPRRLWRRLPAGACEQWRRDGVYEVYGMRLRSTFLEDAERLDIARARRLASAVRSLIAHGTKDDVVPCQDGAAIAAAAAARHRLQLYPGADHRFSPAPEMLDRLLGDIGDWMQQRLEEAARVAAQAGAQ